ncbi:hypothetical protein P5673_002087 [Acropora cervicornis]|uniref:Uncharacterized protein n=1 Tax=Acropora cervicornis TaxID=6130 RepID=A0AAD9R4S2_ACRCE|nr:hypothetical protein P5673_002087 [Acropora cervicornis]
MDTLFASGRDATSTPVRHEVVIRDEQKVAFTTVAYQRRPLSYVFTQAFHRAEDVTQILSTPTLILSPALLAQSSSLSCEVAIHRLVDYRHREGFTCRVMHSTLLQLSSVEIINNTGIVVSTAHVVSGDAIPQIQQVSDPNKCCTLKPEEGERAVLIRGKKDWGICIGKWHGFVKGVPGVAGVKGTEGNRGVRGTPGVKGQPGRLLLKFFALFGMQGWKLISQASQEKFSINLLGGTSRLNVDLRKGQISFPAEIQDVPEAIAIGFAVAILHLLCQPYNPSDASSYMVPSACGVRSQELTPRRIHNEDLALVVAAGYFCGSVPTNSYFKHTVGASWRLRWMRRMWWMRGMWGLWWMWCV